MEVNMKRVYLFILLFFISTFCISCSRTDEYDYKHLTPAEMKNDFSFIQENVYKYHPYFNGIHTNDHYQKLFDEKYNEIYKKLNKPLSVTDYYFKIEELLSSLKDGHTFVGQGDLYNLKGNFSIVLIKYIWLQDGLYISDYYPSIKGIHIGDKVLKINDMTTNQILDNAKTVFSYYNLDGLKYMIAATGLKTGYYLNKIAKNKSNKIKLEVQHNNKIIDVSIPLQKYKDCVNDVKEMQKKRFIYKYQIDKDNNYALFIMNQCNYDSNYTDYLDKFFAEVNKNKITRVALDLRNNPGGDSRVIQEFFFHTQFKQYKDVNGVNTFASGTNEYKGKIYIFTSPRTASSATLFTEIIKDNHMGLIIGEPSSEPASAVGDCKYLTLPDSKLQISVSDKYFARPDINNKDYLVEPDVYIPYTGKDLADNIDPDIDWLEHN